MTSMSGPGPTSTPSPAPVPSPVPAPAPPPGPAPASSDRYKHIRTGQHQARAQPQRTHFIPKIASIESLVSSSENQSQDFNKFQKSIHHHILAMFKNSKDLSKAVQEFSDWYHVGNPRQPHLHD